MQTNNNLELPIPKKITRSTSISETSLAQILKTNNVKALKQLVKQQPEQFDTKRYKHDYIMDVVNNVIKNPQEYKEQFTIIVENKQTANLITDDHITSIINHGSNDALNIILDNKSLHKMIKPEHAHKAIINLDTGITNTLLREAASQNFKIFNAEHIQTAIDSNNNNALTNLLSKNKHNTDITLSPEHVKTAIDLYNNTNQTLDVILQNKPKSLIAKDQNGKDAIEHAISHNNKEAFAYIMKTAPHLITSQHTSTAVKEGNVKAIYEILTHKPEIVTKKHLQEAIKVRDAEIVNAIAIVKPITINKQHVVEAAKTGDVNIINSICEVAFSKGHKETNTSKLRDKALAEIAVSVEISPPNSIERENLLQVMSNLMAAGANSKATFTNRRTGFKTNVNKILARISSTEENNLLSTRVFNTSQAQKKSFFRNLKSSNYIATAPISAESQSTAPEINNTEQVAQNQNISKGPENIASINPGTKTIPTDNDDYLVPQDIKNQNTLENTTTLIDNPIYESADHSKADTNSLRDRETDNESGYETLEENSMHEEHHYEPLRTSNVDENIYEDINDINKPTKDEQQTRRANPNADRPLPELPEPTITQQSGNTTANQEPLYATVNKSTKAQIPKLPDYISLEDSSASENHSPDPTPKAAGSQQSSKLGSSSIC